MNNTKHTKTPWRVYDFGPFAEIGPYIVGVFVDPKGDGGPLRWYTITSHEPRPGVGTYWPARGMGGRSEEESRANALRAAECVNACDGFSLIDGDWVKTHEAMADPAVEIATLRKQLAEMTKNYTDLRDHYTEGSLRGQIAQLRECIGLFTTAGPPGMVMDADNPISMAHKTVAYVAALREAMRLLGKHVAAHRRQWENIASFKLTKSQWRNRARIHRGIEDTGRLVNANPIAAAAVGRVKKKEAQP